METTAWSLLIVIRLQSFFKKKKRCCMCCSVSCMIYVTGNTRQNQLQKMRIKASVDMQLYYRDVR